MKIKYLPFFALACSALTSPLHADLKQHDDTKLVSKLQNDKALDSFSNKYLNIFESVKMFDHHTFVHEVTADELSKFGNLLLDLITLSRFGILSQGEIHEMFKSAGGEERYRKFYRGLIPKTLEQLKNAGEMVHFTDGDYWTNKSLYENFKGALITLSKMETTPLSLMNWAAVDAKIPTKGFPGWLNENQRETISQTLKALDKKSFSLIEGVPGSGKTSAVLIQLVLGMTLVNPKVKVYGTAPNIAGQGALKKDFGEAQKSAPQNGAPAFPNVEILAWDQLASGKVEVAKNSVLIVDEVFTSSISDFSKIVTYCHQNNIVVILSGDSEQNLPYSPSIVGMVDFDGMLVNSRRAKNTKMSEFPKMFMEATIQQNRSSFPEALKLFQDVTYFGNNNDMENMINKDAMEAYKQWVADKKANQFLMMSSPEYNILLNDRFHQSLIDEGFVKNVQDFKVQYERADLQGERYFYLSRWINRSIHVGEGTILSAKNSGQDSTNKPFSKGDKFTVKSISSDKIEAMKDDDGNLLYTFNPGAPLDYAYAINALDSQGATVRNALVYLTDDVTSSELYVMLTRNTGSDAVNPELSGIKIYVPSEGFMGSAQRFINYPWYRLNQDAKDRVKIIKRALNLAGSEGQK